MNNKEFSVLIQKENEYIKIFAVQHVDVCMFSNGKFKNVVAEINENHQIKPGETHRKVYSLLPVKGPTKNWIAVEGNASQSTITSASTDPALFEVNYKIASSAPRSPQSFDERNVFAIYVSYYIKVKLALSGMGGEVSLKLPFILGHVDDSDPNAEQTDHAITSNCTTKIIEEECGPDDSGPLSPMLKEQISTDVPTTPNKTITDSGHINGKSVGDADAIIEDDVHDTVELVEKLKVTCVQSETDGGKDVDDEDDDTTTINVITAQIHHHHPPTEEPTDC